MRIVRDYKEYELTPKELRLAYEEQQAIYDRQNIRDNLDWILDGETKYIIHGKAKSAATQEKQDKVAAAVIALLEDAARPRKSLRKICIMVRGMFWNYTALKKPLQRKSARKR